MKDEFMDQIVYNVRLTWNLACVLIIQRIYNPMVEFLNYLSYKK